MLLLAHVWNERREMPAKGIDVSTVRAHSTFIAKQRFGYIHGREAMLIQRPCPFLGALVLFAFLVGLTGAAEAKEFTFVAQELVKGKGALEMGETEIWLPTEVLIDQKEDLNEPLSFVLENPTGIDHEFAVAGLFMFFSEEAMQALGLKGDRLTERLWQRTC